MGQWRQANTGLQRHPRTATSVPIRVSTVDPEIDPNTGKSFFRSTEETTANLSRGGVFLRSWEPLEAGRRVIVAIDLPSGEELQLTGRVVWTRRELRPDRSRGLEAPGYGIEFSDCSRHELGSLDRLLASFDSAPSRSNTQSPPTPAPARIASAAANGPTTPTTRP